MSTLYPNLAVENIIYSFLYLYGFNGKPNTDEIMFIFGNKHYIIEDKICVKNI